MSPENDDARSQIEALEQRFAENPQGRVFALLADAYRKAGELDQAEELILEGLDKHPNYLSAYIVLGRVNLDRERFADAHEQFTKVLELDPHNLIALKALGDLCVEIHRAEEARTWYEQMLQIDQYNEEAQSALERLDAEQGSGDVSGDSAPPVVEESDAEEEEFGLPFGLDKPDGVAESGELASQESERGPSPLEALASEASEPTAGGGSEFTLSDMDQWKPGLIEDEDLGEEMELDWDDEEGGGMVTETMAELYADQGLYDDAIRVYQELAAVRPYDEKIQTRLRELSELAAQGGSSDPDDGEDASLVEPVGAVDFPEPEEALTLPDPEEAVAIPEADDDMGLADLEEAVSFSDPEEAATISDPEEAAMFSDSEEAVMFSDSEEAVTFADPEAAIGYPDHEEELTLAEEVEAADLIEADDAGLASESEVLAEVGDSYNMGDEGPNLAEADDSDIGTLPDRFEFAVRAVQDSELGHADPFAGSFDVLIRSSETGVSPEPDAESLFPTDGEAEQLAASALEDVALEDAPGIVSDESDIIESDDREPVVSVEAEPSVGEPPSTPAPQPKGEAVVSETIETYLSKILLFSAGERTAERDVGDAVSVGDSGAAEVSEADSDGSRERSESEDSSGSGKKRSEDLAQFQAWLRSLKR